MGRVIVSYAALPAYLLTLYYRIFSLQFMLNIYLVIVTVYVCVHQRKINERCRGNGGTDSQIW